MKILYPFVHCKSFQSILNFFQLLLEIFYENNRKHLKFIFKYIMFLE